MSGEELDIRLGDLDRHVLQRALMLLVKAETTPLEDEAISRLSDALDPGWRQRPPRPSIMEQIRG